MSAPAEQLAALRARLALQLRRQSALARLGQRAMRARASRPFFEEALQTLVGALEADSAALFERRPGGDEGVLRAGVGHPPPWAGGPDKAGRAGLAVVHPDSTPPGDAGLAPPEDTGPAPSGDAVVPGGSRVNVRVPGVRTPWGWISVHSHAPRRFGREDVDFIQAVANALATVVGREACERERQSLNARLERQVAERTRDLKEVLARLETAALTDPLTGLSNRRAFEADAYAEMARAKRQGSGFSLLSLDLDGLKAVNDSRGHAAGDCLLRETARVLQSVLRAQDRAYRVGGDEFIAILPGRPEPAAPLCARVVLQTREQLRDVGFDAGLSAGVAHFPDEAQTLEALVELSDRRMYADKAQNKGKPRR